MLVRCVPCCSKWTAPRAISVIRKKTSTAVDRQLDEEFVMQRTAVDGRMHVTSLNAKTGTRSIMELRIPDKPVSTKISRLAQLPPDAVAGLRGAVLQCSRPPKQIQHEADQLSEKLAQRRFPAPPQAVRDARNKIKKALNRRHEQDDMLTEDQLMDEKIKEAREYQLKNEVDKLLKKTHYNWRPLTLDTREAVAAYALARLAPNYAEVSRVLAEFQRIPDFTPKAVLDFGCGAGSAFWAANKRWGTAVSEYSLVDTNDHMTQFAMDILRGENGSGSSSSRALVHPNISFRRHLVPSLQTTYDLVICHRTLIEIGSQETRNEILSQLWRRTDRYLVLIEDAKEDSFHALLDARDFILQQGMHIDFQETMRLLNEHNVMDEMCNDVLRDNRLGDFEKWNVIKSKLPAGIEPPTSLHPATVFAPCPHDMACPMTDRGSCSVPIRYSAMRADGKKTKRESDGTETGRVSYVILEKGVRDTKAINNNRILAARKLSGHSTCDVCTEFCGIQRLTVSKRGGTLYSAIRGKRDGDVFPAEMKTVATDDPFQLYERARSVGNTSE